MPIFEYICKECDHRFEKLVLGATAVTCPSCRSAKLEKQLSVFAAATKAAVENKIPSGPCGACGDPRGPGACSMN
ncbi:MAG: zinc ribbon domain-containing protein [Acidobacteriota bacterium]